MDISKYTKNSHNSILKINNLIKKWAEDLIKHFIPRKTNRWPTGKDAQHH